MKQSDEIVKIIKEEVAGILHEGIGLGHKFLRHVKRTKRLFHLVSLENEDIVSNLGTYDEKFDLRFLNALIAHHEAGLLMTKEKVKKLSDRDLMIIAAMLYWGEGRKEGELAIINSDVCLMKVFLKGLLKMGIPKNRIKISIRLFSDLDRKKSINFWLSELNLKKDNLISVNYLERKKEGKLPYGMCRLRVEKGSLYFKQLISMIDFVKKLP
jgi:hypothetical protein